MNLLNVENLKLGYDGKTVVKDLSFSVNQGDFVAIVGENGSGKTTLIKGILGLIQRTDGKITFSDDLTKSHIGYLSQQPPFSKDFPASVREIVMSGFGGAGFFGFGYKKTQKEIARKVMDKVGISDLAGKNFSELSGGQQQRVLLCRAMCATDKLLLLDEPTSALDPVITSEFYSLVSMLNREGVSVIMVSHDVNTAVKIASHILHLGSDTYFFGTTHEYMHSDMGKRLLISDCPCDACKHRVKGENKDA